MSDRCQWPRCGKRMQFGEGLSYLGKVLCETHTQQMWKMREQKGLLAVLEKLKVRVPKNVREQITEDETMPATAKKKTAKKKTAKRKKVKARAPKAKRVTAKKAVRGSAKAPDLTSLLVDDDGR